VNSQKAKKKKPRTEHERAKKNERIGKAKGAGALVRTRQGAMVGKEQEGA